MNLEECKRTAPAPRNFTEYQFVVGESDNCELITMYGAVGLPGTPKTINGRRVLSTRTFVPTAYSNGQQSEWEDF